MRKFLSLVLVLLVALTVSGCRKSNSLYGAYSSLSDNSDLQSDVNSLSYICQHAVTSTVNAVDATCTASGYTGDTVCTECNAVVLLGESIAPKGHDTEIRNQQVATASSQGYTGDEYCKICGKITYVGRVIPALQGITPIEKITYTTDSGYTYTVEPNVNITEFSMQQQTKYITHKYNNIEREIFNLCNQEREKHGIAPLIWYEEAYYFAHIRSEEIYTEWSHKRPDGTDWHTVYTNANVILEACAENLAEQQGGNDIAKGIVDAWMNSTSGHRESILNPNFTKIAIAVNYVEDDFTYCVAQHFFN